MQALDSSVEQCIVEDPLNRGLSPRLVEYIEVHLEHDGTFLDYREDQETIDANHLIVKWNTTDGPSWIVNTFSA